MKVQDRNRTENGKRGFIQITHLHTSVHACIHKCTSEHPINTRKVRKGNIRMFRMVYCSGAVICNFFFALFVVVQSLSHVQLFATPWTEERLASPSFIIYRSLLKLMSTESVMSSNHLILCRPLLLPPSIFPSIRAFF